MGYKQSFKGVLVFSDQDALVEAMDLVQSEAAGAELTALHNSFFAPGVMLFDLELSAPESAWQENEEAIGILAENAAKGFVMVRFEGREPEIYEGGAGRPLRDISADATEPGYEEDYFAMPEGVDVTLTGKGFNGEARVEWIVHRGHAESGRHYLYCTKEIDARDKLNPYWGAEAFIPAGGNLYAYDHDSQTRQLLYQGTGKEGQVIVHTQPRFTRFRVLTRLGSRDLKTPYRHFDDCVTVRVSQYDLDESQNFVITEFDQHFARGFGLVGVDHEGGSLRLESFS